MQLVNPPLMGVGLGLLVGLTPLGTLLFPPAAGTASSFSAPTPARCPLSAQCSARPAHITEGRGSPKWQAQTFSRSSEHGLPRLL